jgi:hypothetical protein
LLCSLAALPLLSQKMEHKTITKIKTDA